MVAAINAAIAQRLFTLRPADNRWPEAKSADSRERQHVFPFSIAEIPAIGSISDAGWDELAIHVALWPTAEADRWIKANNAGFLAGEFFASGWLERREGAWLQTTAKPMVASRKSKLAIVAGINVEPRGYADRGRFKM